jgi:hypothetical protein
VPVQGRYAMGEIGHRLGSPRSLPPWPTITRTVPHSAPFKATTIRSNTTWMATRSCLPVSIVDPGQPSQKPHEKRPQTRLTGTASQFAVYAAHGGTAARSRGAFSFDPNTCGDIENAPRTTQSAGKPLHQRAAKAASILWGTCCYPDKRARKKNEATNARHGTRKATTGPCSSTNASNIFIGPMMHPSE